MCYNIFKYKAIKELIYAASNYYIFRQYADSQYQATPGRGFTPLIKAGVILSAVGCISRGCLRDASGIHKRSIEEHCEIVSLIGTVSVKRCHLHISLSKEDLSTIGGHLQEGCIINTTCELVIGEIPGQEIDVTFDEETGYDELILKLLI